MHNQQPQPMHSHVFQSPAAAISIRQPINHFNQQTTPTQTRGRGINGVTGQLAWNRLPPASGGSLSQMTPSLSGGMGVSGLFGRHQPTLHCMNMIQQQSIPPNNQSPTVTGMLPTMMRTSNFGQPHYQPMPSPSMTIGSYPTNGFQSGFPSPAGHGFIPCTPPQPPHPNSARFGAPWTPTKQLNQAQPQPRSQQQRKPGTRPPVPTFSESAQRQTNATGAVARSNNVSTPTQVRHPPPIQITLDTHSEEDDFLEDDDSVSSEQTIHQSMRATHSKRSHRTPRSPRVRVTISSPPPTGLQVSTSTTSTTTTTTTTTLTPPHPPTHQQATTNHTSSAIPNTSNALNSISRPVGQFDRMEDKLKKKKQLAEKKKLEEKKKVEEIRKKKELEEKKKQAAEAKAQEKKGAAAKANTKKVEEEEKKAVSQPPVSTTASNAHKNQLCQEEEEKKAAIKPSANTQHKQNLSSKHKESNANSKGEQVSHRTGDIATRVESASVDSISSSSSTSVIQSKSKRKFQTLREIEKQSEEKSQSRSTEQQEQRKKQLPIHEAKIAESPLVGETKEAPTTTVAKKSSQTRPVKSHSAAPSLPTVAPSPPPSQVSRKRKKSQPELDGYESMDGFVVPNYVDEDDDEDDGIVTHRSRPKHKSKKHRKHTSHQTKRIYSEPSESSDESFEEKSSAVSSPSPSPPLKRRRLRKRVDDSDDEHESSTSATPSSSESQPTVDDECGVHHTQPNITHSNSSSSSSSSTKKKQEEVKSSIQKEKATKAASTLPAPSSAAQSKIHDYTPQLKKGEQKHAKQPTNLTSRKSAHGPASRSSTQHEPQHRSTKHQSNESSNRAVPRSSSHRHEKDHPTPVKVKVNHKRKRKDESATPLVIPPRPTTRRAPTIPKNTNEDEDENEEDDDALSQSTVNDRAAPNKDISMKKKLAENIFLPAGQEPYVEPILDLLHLDFDIPQDQINGCDEVRVELVNQMKLKSYVSDAIDKLDESTRECLRNCVSCQETGAHWSEKDAKEFLASCDENTENALYMTRVRSDHGRYIGRIKSVNRVGQGHFVGFFGGLLMESSKHDRSHSCSFGCLNIAHQYLDSCEYEGPDLTLCFSELRNYAKWIRPPADAVTKIDKSELQASKDRTTKKNKTPVIQKNHLANIRPVFYIDRQLGMLYILLLTVRQLLKNDELLMVRSLGTGWIGEEHFSLVKYSRASHHTHAYITQLEEALLKGVLKDEDGLDDDATERRFKRLAPVDRARKLLNLDILPEFTSVPPHSHVLPAFSFDLPFKPTNRSEFESWELVDAFLRSDVIHIKRSFLSESAKRNPKIVQVFNSLADSMPERFLSHDDKEEFEVDREQVEFILDNGFDKRFIELCEDVSLQSCVRLFTPPSQPSFSVRAKQDIERGTFVYAYAGCIFEEGEQDDASEYVYTIDPEAAQKVIRDWPIELRLVLDAKRFGNIGRFVNDNRYRELSYDTQERFINVEARWMFYKGMIHFAFYTIKPVRKGQELITHYGDAYWVSTSRTLTAFHAKFTGDALQYATRLEEICKSKKIDLPEAPVLAIESTTPFRRKVVPYPRRTLSSLDENALPSPKDHAEMEDEDEEEKKDGVKVEDEEEGAEADVNAYEMAIMAQYQARIVGRRREPITGEYQYFVQHRSDSNFYPRWLIQNQLSTRLREKKLAGINREWDESERLDRRLTIPLDYMPTADFKTTRPTIRYVPDPSDSDEYEDGDSSDDEYVPQTKRTKRIQSDPTRTKHKSTTTKPKKKNKKQSKTKSRTKPPTHSKKRPPARRPPSSSEEEESEETEESWSDSVSESESDPPTDEEMSDD